MGYDRAVPTRIHRSAQVEDGVNALIERLLRRRAWRARVLPYTGYGTDGWVRVLARVLLTPPGTRRRDMETGRGWRRFLSAPAPGVTVTVIVGDRVHEVVTGRGGYIDATVRADLEPGWSRVRLSAEGSPITEAPVQVVAPGARIGVVCDVDDTVMITALPRPLLAFWNTFVRHEAHRRPVPGMAAFLRAVLAQDPESFIAYLSTGAWNVAPALEHFLAREGFPRGPLLLTDWGPTPEGWFRSGRQHKRSELCRLITQLPQLTWVLVGDDGQHDPELYEEAADGAPGRVRAAAIRQLTPAEQVLTHGTPEPLSELPWVPSRPESPLRMLRAADGRDLLAAFRERGLLD
jgi:phosphatidate phosphatase APP1